MKRISISFIVIILSFTAYGQEALQLSLDQAINYALKHNYNIVNAKTDIKIAKKRIAETRAIGLPQINASAGYDYYLDIPTQLIPDFLTPTLIGVNQQVFGLTPIVPVSEDPQMLELSFGQEHNFKAGVTASQLIFNGSYIVGLQAASSYKQLTETQLSKQEIDVKASVKNAYYPIIILKENMSLLDSTLANLQILRYETNQLYKAGFVEDVDVDQIELMISQLEATYSNMNSQMEIMKKNLKMHLGLDVDANIELTDQLSDYISDVNSTILNNPNFNFNQHIDYQIMEDQKAMALLDIRNKKAEYLPSLSAYYTYQQNAQRDEFNFFDEDENWFPTQILGVQMDIPIFGSWGKNAKVQQAKLNYDKLKVASDQLKTGINIKLDAARTEFENAWLIYNNKEKSLDISKKIYDKTEIKYKEGVSSSLELTQTFNQFLNTEMEYLNALLDLLSKKTNLEKELEN